MTTLGRKSTHKTLKRFGKDEVIQRRGTAQAKNEYRGDERDHRGSVKSVKGTRRGKRR